jgi:replicative DNA helicase
MSQALPDRTIPSDFDAEQATLGAMLLETGAAEMALAIAAPQDYYREYHQRIAEACQTCLRSRSPDPTTPPPKVRAWRVSSRC